ncbi:hypothetical protein Pla22_21090 [Rubripirellula amarantea]|uniref:Uncharacterized protein n=1 Tax=Rubripirellula amarantea TaxID=2527999 RepID=A0A5C5WX64_9BACT|nr:hypothetical protein [Rubripirellula amarantea]TWT54462.1 hypothetical protein Pla22_21090 [Rubripirellula amarantea]
MNAPSPEPIQRSRLLPRVSFRAMFALMTLGVIFAAIARAAGDGAVVATGFMVATGFLLACFVAFLLLFMLAWCVSVTWYQPSEEIQTDDSPFSDDTLPSQILPPREQRP